MWTNEERQQTLLELDGDKSLSPEKKRYLNKLRAGVVLLSKKTQISVSDDAINQCRLAQLQFLFNLPSHEMTDFLETTVESLTEIYGIYWAVNDFLDLNIALSNLAFIAKGVSFIAGISLALFLQMLSRHQGQVQKIRELLTIIEYNQLQERQKRLNIPSPNLHKTEPQPPQKSAGRAAFKAFASKKVWHSLLTGIAVFGGVCEIYWALTTIHVISTLLATSSISILGLLVPIGLMVPLLGGFIAVTLGLLAAYYRYHVMKKAELQQQQLKNIQRSSLAVENATPDILNATDDLNISNRSEITSTDTTATPSDAELNKPTSSKTYSLAKKPGYLIQYTVILTCVFLLTYWCISEALKISILLTIPALSGALGIGILASLVMAYFLYRNVLRDEHRAAKHLTQVERINTQRQALLGLLCKDKLQQQQQQHEIPQSPFIPQKKPMLKMIVNATMTGASVALTLFAFYYGVAAVFGTLALLPVTSLFSALALGAVVCSALAIGIYFAVQHYHRQVSIHQQQNNLMRIEHENRALLTGIEKRLQSKKTSEVSEEFTKEGDLKTHGTPTTTDIDVRPSDHPTQPVVTSGSSVGFWPVATPQAQPADSVEQLERSSSETAPMLKGAGLG
jgi:hypothetical protein